MTRVKRFQKGSAALQRVKEGAKESSLLDWDWVHLKYSMDLEEQMKK